MASVTVAEAQRLIAMSLGKIAASRTQRGGINLHRNLLVAGVLHKAKTAYMMENYHQIMAARKQQQEAQQLQMMSVQVNTSPCPTPGPNAVSRVGPVATHAPFLPAPAPAQTGEREPPSPACQEAGSQSGSGAQRLAAACVAAEEAAAQDKENTPPPAAALASSPSALCSKEEDVPPKSSSGSVSQLSERLSPKENQDYTSGSSPSSCGRCVLKRRSSSGESDTESSSPKKARLGECQDSCENLSWGSPAPSPLSPSPLSPSVEPMQVDPPQINNLVNIFNAGLSGLCSSQNSDSGDSSSSHSILAGFGSRAQRVMDTSLLCGSQAIDNRMDSGPQAIALTV